MQKLPISQLLSIKFLVDDGAKSCMFCTVDDTKSTLTDRFQVCQFTGRYLAVLWYVILKTDNYEWNTVSRVLKLLRYATRHVRLHINQLVNQSINQSNLNSDNTAHKTVINRKHRQPDAVVACEMRFPNSRMMVPTCSKLSCKGDTLRITTSLHRQKLESLTTFCQQMEGGCWNYKHTDKWIDGIYDCAQQI